MDGAWLPKIIFRAGLYTTLYFRAAGIILSVDAVIPGSEYGSGVGTSEGEESLGKEVLHDKVPDFL